MKRILLIGLILFLVGCSNAASGGFTVDEETFKEAYEEQSDRNFPTNITYDPEEMMRIEGASESEVIPFLNTADQLLDGEEVRRLKESIDNGEDNIPNTIEAEDYMINVFNREDGYTISIVPYDGE